MSAIFNQAKEGKSRFFIQFGGQGAPWYKELAVYYKDGKMKKFFDAALGALEEERSRIEGRVGLPLGLNAKAWLDDEAAIPSEEYLGCASVSIPMIQMTQLAHFEHLTQNGFERSKLIEYSLGATGHSQGLIPACLVAMGRDKDDDYYSALQKYIKYLIYLGLRAQEAHPHFAATDDENAKAKGLGEKGSPSPMVAVLGETHDDIKKLVEETNAKLPADKQIYISLINSPSNRILSSYRSSLLEFQAMHKAHMDEKKIKFVYLRTTCPFHSPLMNRITELFEPDITRIGFTYRGTDLKIPTYSFYDGRNMQNDGDKLPIHMYMDMAVHNLFWDKSIKPAADDAKITHVIDFGPGKTSQRLTQDTLAGFKCEKPVFAVAFAKDWKELTA